MIYSITYDLRKPGQDYEGLYESIKSLGDCRHYLESTWLVDTQLNADMIYKRLESNIDKNDSILIVNFGTDYWGFLPKDAWEWIKERQKSKAS